MSFPVIKSFAKINDLLSPWNVTLGRLNHLVRHGERQELSSPETPFWNLTKFPVVDTTGGFITGYVVYSNRRVIDSDALGFSAVPMKVEKPTVSWTCTLAMNFNSHNSYNLRHLVQSIQPAEGTYLYIGVSKPGVEVFGDSFELAATACVFGCPSVTYTGFGLTKSYAIPAAGELVTKAQVVNNNPKDFPLPFVIGTGHSNYAANVKDVVAFFSDAPMFNVALLVQGHASTVVDIGSAALVTIDNVSSLLLSTLAVSGYKASTLERQAVAIQREVRQAVTAKAGNPAELKALLDQEIARKPNLQMPDGLTEAVIASLPTGPIAGYTGKATLTATRADVQEALKRYLNQTAKEPVEVKYVTGKVENAVNYMRAVRTKGPAQIEATRKRADPNVPLPGRQRVTAADLADLL